MRVIFQNASWALALIPVSAGLGAAQLALQARILGPSAMGLLFFVLTVVSFAGGVIKPRGSDSVIALGGRALASGNLTRAGLMMRSSLALDLISASFVLLLIWVGTFVHSVVNEWGTEHEMFIALSLTVVSFSTHATAHAVLRISDHFSWVFWHSTAISFLKLFLIFLIFWFGGGLWYVVAAVVFTSSIEFITLLWLTALAGSRKGLGIFSDWSWCDIFDQEFRTFQSAGYVRSFAKSVQANADILLLGWLGSTSQVGIYKAAKVFLDVLDMPIQALQTSLAPEYARLWHTGNQKRVRRITLVLTTLLSIFGLIGILTIGIIGEWLIEIIFGPEFQGAAPVLHTFMLILCFSALITPINGVQLAIGQSKPATIASMVSLVALIASLVTLVPTHGASGGAWARMISLMASALIVIPPAVILLRRQ